MWKEIEIFEHKQKQTFLKPYSNCLIMRLMGNLLKEKEIKELEADLLTDLT